MDKIQIMLNIILSNLEFVFAWVLFRSLFKLKNGDWVKNISMGVGIRIVWHILWYMNVPWLLYLIIFILFLIFMKYPRKSKLIGKIGILNYWSLPFSIEKLSDSYESEGWIPKENHHVSIATFFDKDSTDPLRCTIDRDGPKFQFTGDHWERFKKISDIKRTHVEAICLLCPNTMTFCYGFYTYLLPKDLIMTSYYTPTKKFTHIHQSTFDGEELKPNSNDKQYFERSIFTNTPPKSILIFIAISYTKQSIRFRNILGSKGLDFDFDMIQIIEPKEIGLEISDDNYKSVLKDLIQHVNKILDREGKEKIGFVLEVPGSIAFGLGLYMTGHRFDSYDRIYIGEPTDETRESYIFEKLSNIGKSMM